MVYQRGGEYDGSKDRMILAKWRNLTSSLDTTSRIPSLIWTDIAANMLVGTKSLIGGIPANQPYQVLSFERKITYKLLYAIPACACLLFWVIWFLLAAFMFLGSRVSLRIIQNLSNNLSAGRAITSAIYPEKCDPSIETKEWVRKVGQSKILISQGKVAYGRAQGSRRGKGERRPISGQSTLEPTPGS
jgi:hypothetical protein